MKIDYTDKKKTLMLHIVDAYPSHLTTRRKRFRIDKVRCVRAHPLGGALSRQGRSRCNGFTCPQAVTQRSAKPN